MDRATSFAAVLSSLVALASLFPAPASAQEGEEGFTPIFDGKSLAGWKGRSDLWSVADGSIVGSTRPDGLKGNTFLVSEKEYEDFILRLEFKISAGNSGVQFRSHQIREPDSYIVAGYQADIGEGWFGTLYDEERRGLLIKSPLELVQSRFLKKDDWNRYEIAAVGSRITLTLNGIITAEHDEKDADISRRGILALQLHSGGPMEIRFRNLRVREVEKKKLLYVTTAAGFAHSSRPLSREVVTKLGRDSGLFEATTTDSTELITPEGLKGFDAVLFYTTGDVEQFPLTRENREHLIAWVKEGHAFAGVHSATDTYKDWEPYWEMIGGSFDGHPWHESITVDVEDPSHPAAYHVPHGWEITDEIYQFKNYARDRIHVILSMRDVSVKGKGKRADNDYAISWCRNFGEGRVFYTSLGHREDVWTNPTYQAHLLGGLLWALGLAAGDATPGLPKPGNEFTPLFDGKTLSGWTPNSVDGAKVEWLVEDGGVLTAKGQHGHLFSPKAYENFHYQAEVKIGDGANSGMYFRAEKGRPWPAGFEAQVNSTYQGDLVRTGSLYSIRKEFRQLVPPDTWFTQEVIASGNHIIIKVNGKITADEVVPPASSPGMAWKRGHFAFQFHDPGCKVWYRNVMVRELPAVEGVKTAAGG
jgi:type 1 glutamine amidotransferase